MLAKVKTEGWSQTLTKVFAKLNAPLPLGYSAAGVVREVGRDAGNLRVGDRVACGGAGYASHAEANFIPKNLCVHIPDNVTFEQASFTTLGSIALQGVRQTDPRLGEVVGVIGLGLLGLLTVQLLKAAGCCVVGTDLDPAKLELATSFGCDHAVAPDLFIDTCIRAGGGHGVDATVITAAAKSNGPIETAAEATRQKGRVVVVGLVGMELPRDPFYKKELDLRLSMSYGPGRYDAAYEEAGHDYPYAHVRWTEQRNMQSFLYLVSTGAVKLDALVTHRFAIDDALGAYELLETGREKYLGIVLTFPEPDVNRVPTKRVELRSAPLDKGKLNVAFVGAGNFTKAVLLPAFKNNSSVDLAGLCTSTGMTGSEVGKEQGFRYATTDLSELLAHPSTDAVVIATPHGSHAALTLQALRAGKPTYVEKPLCIKPEQLADFDAFFAETEKPPVLMVGFNRRFSPHAEALRRQFHNRQTPMAVTYRVNAGVIPPDVWIQDPENGGGRIVGEVCHFVDFASSVIGSEIVAVQAGSVRERDGRYTDADSMTGLLHYADGSMATISYLAHGHNTLPKERAEIYADGTTAVLDNFTRTDFYGGGEKTLKGKQAKGFPEEVAAFVAGVRSGAWPIPWPALRNTTTATFALQEALRSGGTIEP